WRCAMVVSDAPREAFALPDGCEEGYLIVNGMRLHYAAAGSGPLTILLHGFPEFWYSWRYQLSALAAMRRVVALDMRGYNLSDKPASGYDLATLSSDVRGVIEALGERRADIVGHDWGGLIAWTFAMREPDYLRRLVVLNAPHPATLTREWRHPGQLRRSAYVGFFQLRGIAEDMIARDNFSFLWRTFRSADRGRAWLADEDIQRYVDAIARPGALTAALSYYRQPVQSSAAALSPARVIHAPTLLLWGELDRYLGPWMADGLEPWVSDLRVRRFSTAGHWLSQQIPERINTELLAFLGEDDG
ncbi:MAG TPA: alpha/beta hydrolase, partial [Ktedonobacterales bacterium]|nr:alpha/beta hydrolase [Ktedonobacterales bacterium]